MDRLPLLKPAHKHQKQADNRFAPKITKQLEPCKVVEGKPYTLSVEYAANPKCEVIWYKDGFQMQSSEDFFIETTNTNCLLRIKKTFKSDTGMYQVKLFNEVGLAQSRAYLTVTPGNFFSNIKNNII